MKLTIIGCASGMPSPNLAHSCYIIEESGRLYMFDCGEGASSSLLRCSVDILSISNIFISHTHPDHVAGLPLFIQMMYLKNRAEPLTIYLPSEFRNVVDTILRGLYLFPEKLGFDLSIKGIDDDFEFDNGGIRVTAHPNSHLKGHSEFLRSRDYENRMQCFSFIVSSGVRKFVYSADIGDIDNLRDIISDVDLLLTEGIHLDLEKLPELLIEKKVKRCLLTHLPDDFDREGIKRLFAKAGYESLDFAAEGADFIV